MVKSVGFVVLIVSVVLGKNLDVTNDNRGAVVEKGCENVAQFFLVKNVTISRGNTKGGVCNGQCCDDRTEAVLRQQAQKDFATLLRHNSRSLQGLLASTAGTLQSHVLELARQSENKTLTIFGQVYRSMSGLARQPTSKLYENIINYFNNNKVITPEDIVDTVKDFFKNLFPLAYHHSSNTSLGKDFSEEYKECLKKSIENISPFGDVPKQISGSLSKSLETTRLLLQAFNIGIDVLNTTDSILINENSNDNSQCYEALVKMIYCPKCLGLYKHTKPCSGYCLNVLRGCITKYVAELDLPWNGYVEGIESLLNAVRKSSNDAGVNLDAVIRSLDTRISSAIMNYLSRGKDIDAKVKIHCGSPDVVRIKEEVLLPEIATPAPTISTGNLPKTRSTGGVSRNYFVPLPESELSRFLNAISKSKGFYANLANTLCQDSSFAEPKDRQCWNGERIAEYTKTVVDVGLDMQKYNPEVKPSINTQSVDPKIAGLVDKLRRVHHMAVTSLGPNYQDADYMQRDGTEGSGSGAGAGTDFDEDDRDDDYMRGSGSGDGPPGTNEDGNDGVGSRTVPVDFQPSDGNKTPTEPKIISGCDCLHFNNNNYCYRKWLNAAIIIVALILIN